MNYANEKIELKKLMPNRWDVDFNNDGCELGFSLT